MVQKEGETIKNSAKILNIKESTAKLIVSRFRTCGTIYEGKKNHINRKAKSKGEKRPRTIKS
jgi:transposase